MTDQSRPLFARTLRPDRLAIYYATFALLGTLLIISSLEIGMLNQGDYPRAVGRILNYPLGSGGGFDSPQGYRWAFQAGVGRPSVGGGSSSLLFWLMALLQRPFAGQFNLLWMGVLGKLWLLWLMDRLACRLSVLFRGGLFARFLLLSVFTLLSFAAHNIAFVNSFYMEFALFLFLPAVLLATVLPRGRLSRWGLWLGAWLCGAAKAQYFYFPGLLLSVLCFMDWRLGRRLDRTAVTGLLLVQLLALPPLLHSSFRQLNYHHATYWGSYLVLQPPERLALGLTEQQQRCVGVDAWGNRLQSAASTHISAGSASCFGQRQLGLKDVLAPYRRFPAALPRLWRQAAGAHFTVDYFHVDERSRYIAPTSGNGFAAGSWLLGLTHRRDALISPAVAIGWALLALGLAVARPQIGGVPLGLPLAVLSLFSLTQLLVALLGEGIRDLSRHWAGAQLAFDWLLVLSLLHLTALFWQRRLAPQSAAPHIHGAPTCRVNGWTPPGQCW